MTCGWEHGPGTLALFHWDWHSILGRANIFWKQVSYVVPLPHRYCQAILAILHGRGCVTLLKGD